MTPRFFSLGPLQRAFWGAGLLFGAVASAHAQEGTAPANQADTTAVPSSPTPAQPTSPAATEEAPKTGLALGADLFYGSSNLPSAHRFRDGFWLGSGAYFPSNVYALYNAKDGTSAKVAVSLGKFYNGSVPGFDQPIEAYVSRPLGKTTFTAGKFYVPFELQEWEYETEYGLQAARDLGKRGSVVAALTYNRRRDTPNAYLRYARSIGPATVGLSLGGGRGFSFDTDHDRGASLDLTVERGRFRLESAALLAQKSSASSRFLFAFARLNFQLNPKTKLYLARHSWSDRLDQQGNGHFSTLGAVYRLTPHLALEGAVSRSGELKRNINWIELHYTAQR